MLLLGVGLAVGKPLFLGSQVSFLRMKLYPDYFKKV